jgi:hypothetical protein
MEGSGSGRISNQFASWIRIQNSGLRISESGAERNIYGSTTLDNRQEESIYKFLKLLVPHITLYITVCTVLYTEAPTD